MAEQEQVWNVAVETMQAFGPFYQEATAPVLRNAPANWVYLRAAAGLDPQPLTTGAAHTFTPYTSREVVETSLAGLVADGMLQPEGDTYRLTNAGREQVNMFYEAAQDALGEVEPLTDTGPELRDLLRRIVGAVEESPQPEIKLAFAASRRTGPGPEAGLYTQIDQFITDLYHFRDDSHISAWRPTDLSGLAWEALTFIWRDQAHTADQLAEQLEGRRLSTEAYAEALQELAQRDLVQKGQDGYGVTEAGRQLREDVEAATDRIFYAPWSALDGGEVEQLHTLLRETNDELKKAALRRMWPLLYSVSQSINPVTRKVVMPVYNEYFKQPGQFINTRLAREIDPEPYTVAHYRYRYPYTSPEYLDRKLRELDEAGLLRAEGDGKFTISENGRAAVDELNDIFYENLSKVEVLAEERMARLVSLLQRLVTAALESDLPRGRALQQSHDAPLQRDYCPLARVDLLLDDMTVFREAGHIVSWSSLDVDARAWETLTLLWREQAATAEELAEALSYQGYTAEDYAHSLQALAERGWAERTGDRYRVTEEGVAVRQKAEDDTDAYFYSVWSVLDEAEQAELRFLLIHLKVLLEEALAVQQAAEASAAEPSAVEVTA